MSDMDEMMDDLSIPEDIGGEEEAIDVVGDIMDRFLSIGDVTAVYGEPIDHGDTLIIPAAEVIAVAGFGVGYGYGQGQGKEQGYCPDCEMDEMDEEEGDEELTGEPGDEVTDEEDWDDEDLYEDEDEEGPASGGGGGGGGGKVLSRPVAVIVVSGDGQVRVEPVVDATKIVLAALVTGGFMVATLLGLFRPRRH